MSKPHDPTQPLAKWGISLRIYPHDVDAASRVDIARHQAALGVAAGFDGVMVSEHHADFPGYLPNPVQLANFLLSAMPRGWAAACPLLLPMKPYAFFAEDIAWSNAAYPGRVGAGFAAGALPVDFELAEVPFDEIIDRFKAALPKVVEALRGNDPTPLGADRALVACADAPIPMCAATQSPAAVRRAAKHGLGVLYDSLQGSDMSKRLSDVYDEAGGDQAKIVIRRVWIGDPPTDEMAAQMEHYRSYAPDRAIKNWGTGDQLVHGATFDEVADRLATLMADSNCDTINIRTHVKGLSPEQVNDQIGHYEGNIETLRNAIQGAQS